MAEAGSTGRSTALEAWVLAPDHGPGMGARMKEIWRYRRIIQFFAARSVRMLYARTSLGWSWLLIRPLAPLVAGALVYGGVMSVPSEGVPYFLFFVTGSVIWGYFENPLGWGTRGLELNRNLIAKLYFPRMVLPLASMSAGLVDPVVNSGILISSVFYYYYTTGIWYVQLTPKLLLAPVAVLLAMAFAFSLALSLSLWQVRARDVRFALGYVTGFWFFFTPVIYPLSGIPESYQWLARANPITAPVETFKWAVLGIGEFHLGGFLYSFVVTTATLLGSAWYFAVMESRTADKV